MPLARHTRLGPYEILEPLGAGGMGEVYRARDTRLQREVAIKVLREQRANDPEALLRFEREMQAIASVSHPNIVAIYDVGVEDGTTYAVMELLRGETLRDRLRKGAMPWKRALATATAIASGLAAAHDKGIVHRDIKPENIFLTTDDAVKILDFGLVRLQAEEKVPAQHSSDPGALVTQKGVLMGTVSYMAPEQVRGEVADARSDVFAFGCVFYEMIAGRNPFLCETNVATMAAILFDSVSRPGLCSGQPAWVDQLILRCLEKQPERRFSSGREILQTLKNLGHYPAEEEEDQLSDLDTVQFEESPFVVPAPEVPAAPSVAVLPFRNLSPDPDNEYFSDGLAEELMSALTRVDGLRVASRTSAFAFKGKNDDIRKIGSQLSVGAVLEGSVRKAGNRLRISAQLVNVSDGFEIWSETYDRELEDVFAIQEEIARNIVAALSVVFREQAQKALAKKQTHHVKAEEFAQRGQQFCREFRRKSFEYALIMYRRAVAVDADYVQGHAGEAICHALLYTWWNRDPARLQQADEAALRALQMQPNLPDGHVAAGVTLTLHRQFVEAEEAFRKAIQLDAKSFEAHYFFSQCCLAQGNLTTAAQLLEQSARLRPEDFEAGSQLASICARLNQEAEAIAAAQQCLRVIESHLALHPEDTRATYLGAILWSQLGEPRRALEWADCAISMDPDEPLTLCHVARVYARESLIDKAMENLEKAVAYGFANRDWLGQESDFDALRPEARFQQLLKQVPSSEDLT